MNKKIVFAMAFAAFSLQSVCAVTDLAKKDSDVAKSLAVLDTIIESQPQLFRLFVMTRKTANKVLVAIDKRKEQTKEAQQNELDFVVNHRTNLLKLVKSFVGVILENKSMVQPILTASLGAPSKHIDPFFDVTEQTMGSFFESIDTVEKLEGIAREISTVITDLCSEKNLPKASIAFQASMDARRAQAVVAA